MSNGVRNKKGGQNERFLTRYAGWNRIIEPDDLTVGWKRGR